MSVCGWVFCFLVSTFILEPDFQMFRHCEVFALVHMMYVNCYNLKLTQIVFLGFLVGVLRLIVLLFALTSANTSEFMDLEGMSLDVMPPLHDVELEGIERVPRRNKQDVRNLGYLSQRFSRCPPQIRGGA